MIWVERIQRLTKNHCDKISFFCFLGIYCGDLATVAQNRNSIRQGQDFIGAVIGPGGKIIQQLQKDTDTVISIEEMGEIGRIEISGTDREKINAAIARINEITFVPVVGTVYKGKVVKVMDFGAFVAIAKGTEGLLHISEIEWKRLDKVPYAEGDEVEVKISEASAHYLIGEPLSVRQTRGAQAHQVRIETPGPASTMLGIPTVKR